MRAHDAATTRLTRLILCNGISDRSGASRFSARAPSGPPWTAPPPLRPTMANGHKRHRQERALSHWLVLFPFRHRCDPAFLTCRSRAAGALLRCRVQRRLGSGRLAVARRARAPLTRRSGAACPRAAEAAPLARRSGAARPRAAKAARAPRKRRAPRGRRMGDTRAPSGRCLAPAPLQRCSVRAPLARHMCARDFKAARAPLQRRPRAAQAPCGRHAGGVCAPLGLRSRATSAPLARARCSGDGRARRLGVARHRVFCICCQWRRRYFMSRDAPL